MGVGRAARAGASCSLARVPELRWRRWRWDLTDDGIDIQNGAFIVNRTLIPWVRVQHVETQRGLFEQAFGLATVIVHNAAGCAHDPAAPAGRRRGAARADRPPGEDRRR